MWPRSYLSRVLRSVAAALILAPAIPAAAPESTATSPWASPAPPPLRRALVSVPVAVVAESGGARVLTDIVEIDFDWPLKEQVPPGAPVLVSENGGYRAFTEVDGGLGAPMEVEVGSWGEPYIPRLAGKHLGTERAGPEARAALAGWRERTVPIRYTSPERLRRLAHGPPSLVRSDAAGFFAVVPERVLIDEQGEFHISLKEIGPFAAAPGLADLPRTAPVFSRFADGTERSGAFRRNYHDAAVHYLDDRSAREFIFSPGLGYQFLQSGPTGYCGTGLQNVKPRHEPGACEPDPMPGSESVPITYHLNPTTVGTLTPTLRWTGELNGAAYHVFICEGALVCDPLQMFGREQVAGGALRVPEGVLRPGMTYHWLVTAENAIGCSYRRMIFATSADAVPGGFEFLDAPPARNDLP